MSMVVFPFKAEPREVARKNLERALSHPRVSHVLAIGAERNELFAHLSRSAAELSSLTGTQMEVVVQERIGDRRPGKGDGMNTGLRRFLHSGEDRLHFYDADITNFDHTWIDGAERAAEEGFDIVRHYFPRASTDAMVTWMITRPLLAMGHPASGLWKIRQPLGGELLITRPIVEKLVGDDLVAGRSDWGIDTAITYATAVTGQGIYEHYIPDGKQHTLYGSLAELREMVHECFETAIEISRMATPPPFEHRVEPAAPAPPAIAHRVAYDLEATLRLLTSDWSPGELEAVAALPRQLAEPLLSNRTGRPTFAFLDAERWFVALESLRDLYRPDPAWRSLLFRLWVGRVLAYTMTDALTGHTRSMEILEETLARYAARS